MIRYFEKQMEELNYSIHSLDENIFERWVEDATEALEKGHKIIASGLGKNVPICEKFVGSMISMGYEACFLHTNSAVHGDMGVVKDGDMVILLTKSGETEESVNLVRLLISLLHHFQTYVNIFEVLYFDYHHSPFQLPLAVYFS